MKIRVSFIEPELKAAEKETDGGTVLSVGKQRTTRQKDLHLLNRAPAFSNLKKK